MVQIVRNVTIADWGFLEPGQYLIHDRNEKCCPEFQLPGVGTLPELEPRDQWGAAQRQVLSWRVHKNNPTRPCFYHSQCLFLCNHLKNVDLRSPLG